GSIARLCALFAPIAVDGVSAHADRPDAALCAYGLACRAAPQVNFSAQILFQELRASRGYSGGYDTVRNAVRPLRTEAAAAALTQRRFETLPGQQAQVDWGQVRVPFAAATATV